MLDFERDFSGLLQFCRNINESMYRNRLFAYVTESAKASDFLWRNIEIHSEYDKLVHRLVKSLERPLADCSLDSVNRTLLLPGKNQIMLFTESEQFLKICKSIQFASITHTCEIQVVKLLK